MFRDYQCGLLETHEHYPCNVSMEELEHYALGDESVSEKRKGAVTDCSDGLPCLLQEDKHLDVSWCRC